MRSKKVEFRWPHLLVDRLEELTKKEGYPNMSRLVMALAIWAVVSPVRWKLLLRVAGAGVDEQDELLSVMLNSDDEEFASMMMSHAKKRR